jgi:hypothetical protein
MHSTAYSAGDLGHVDEPVVARCLGPLGGVYGLAAQRREIGAACKAKGWKAGKIYTDVSSGKTTNGRAGLSTALGRLAAGTADALVVAKLDRVSRSVRDTANLLERAKEERWQLVVLDNTGIDTTTPNGRMFCEPYGDARRVGARDDLRAHEGGARRSTSGREAHWSRSIGER